jgi:hypothetical protein
MKQQMCSMGKRSSLFNVFMLHDIALNVIWKDLIIIIIIMSNVIRLNVIKPNVIMLHDIALSVILKISLQWSS